MVELAAALLGIFIADLIFEGIADYRDQLKRHRNAKARFAAAQARRQQSLGVNTNYEAYRERELAARWVGMTIWCQSSPELRQ